MRSGQKRLFTATAGCIRIVSPYTGAMRRKPFPIASGPSRRAVRLPPCIPESAMRHPF
jgi:hypothetical protein